ncbi:alpha/beta fold hydrolase [Micromonospora echinospora]|uniref:alpha/beta hydrolase family protein n=1 Tax=Micromonospora echinospora TaxID=1877 RepID=UPI003A8467DA
MPILEDTTTTPDGRQVAMLVATPATPPQGLVVVLPAMGVAARFYRAFADRLSGHGHLVAVVDLPGQGASPTRVRRGSDLGYADLVAGEVTAALRWIRREHPSRPVFLVGHSLGGHLALRYATQPDAGLAGVVLVASGSVWYRSFGLLGGVRNLLFSQVFAGIARVLGYWPGDRLRFGGRQPARVMRDWAAQVRSGDMTGGTGRDGRAFGCRTPVLVVSVDHDRLAPPAAVRYLTAAVPHAPVEQWHYGSAAADGPVDHFRWAKRPDPVADRIDDWMRATTAVRATEQEPGKADHDH